MTSYFSGKVAIVSGSSQGIGRSTAQMLASLGAKVTITGRNEQALDETKSLMLSAGAKLEDIATVIGNIQEEATYSKIIEETINKFGQIDVLINNAGSLSQDNSRQVGLAGLDDYDYTMNLNVRSVVALTKLALPHLEKTKGSIVMVSSIASEMAHPTFPYYAMSKAAIDRLTQCLALTYIEKGVRVNAVNPGFTSTALLEKLGMKRDEIDAFEAKNTTDRSQIPIGRAGRPSEIAELILFLADTSKSEYIIGQCIIIDGGKSLVRNMANPNQ